MKYLTPILILSLILSIVAFSGCIGEAQNKTYSKNGLNFTYPGDMKENASFVFVSMPNGSMQYDTLGNDKLKIAIVKVPIDNAIKQYFTFDQFKSLAQNYLENPGNNKTTNLSLLDKSKNGTTIYEVIYTSKDPVSDAELKNKEIVIFKDYNTMYEVFFQTNASDFASQQEIINAIQNSIVLT